MAGRLTQKTVGVLHARAVELNAIAHALYDDGHTDLTDPLLQAAADIAAISRSLERKLVDNPIHSPAGAA